MVALLVVQSIAAGFCLMAPSATMPVLSMEQAMTDSSESSMGHRDSAHCHPSFSIHSVSENAPEKRMPKAPCAHCDQPDQLLLSTLQADDLDGLHHLVGSLSLLSVSLVPVMAQRIHTRINTGPPRSSSLLYTTTQRLRI